MIDGLRNWLIKKLGGRLEGELEFFRLQVSREQERAEHLQSLLFQARHPDVEETVQHVRSHLRPITTAKLPWNQVRANLERSDRESMMKEKKDGLPA